MGGGGLYRAWKRRKKIKASAFKKVAGGLYLKTSVAKQIEKYGMPRKESQC